MRNFLRQAAIKHQAERVPADGIEIPFRLVDQRDVRAGGSVADEFEGRRPRVFANRQFPVKRAVAFPADDDFKAVGLVSPASASAKTVPSVADTPA